MMKKKGYKKGGVTKKMGGGAMKKKPVAMKKGSRVMKKTDGGKMPMVKGKDGKMVPAFAADGKGKMKKGGTVKKMYGGKMKKKGMAKGGATKKMAGGKMKKKMMAKGGVMRGGGAATRGKRFSRSA